MATALFQAFFAFPQRIGQPLDDCAIDVRPCMHIAKTDHGAFGVWPGYADSRRPVGLHDQAHGPCGHLSDEIVKQALYRNTALPGQALFTQAKLALEPVHHPVPALHDSFGVVRIGHGRGIGGYMFDGFDVSGIRAVISAVVP